MFGLNRNQLLAIVIATLSVLMASTAQLTDLFGVALAKAVVSGAGLLNGILSSWLAVLTSQSGLVHDVQDMPGVERIQVNRQANTTLAQIALDPEAQKVVPLAEDKVKIRETANSGVS